MVSDTILIGLMSSPVIMTVVQAMINRRPHIKTIDKIEEVRKTFNDYKIEKAAQELMQKNWRIIDASRITTYCIREWILLQENLRRLLPEDEWSETLKMETLKASDKIKEIK